jgi:protease-4
VSKQIGMLCLLLCLVASPLVPCVLAAAGTGSVEDRPHPLADYQNESDFLAATPSVTGGAVGALGNPAAWSTGDRSEAAFWWNDRTSEARSLDNWGLSIGHTIGFAFNRQTVRSGPRTYRLDDYQLGLAWGNRRNHAGIAYRWSQSQTEAIPRQDAVILGVISRPNRWYSLGLAGQLSTESSARLGVFDLGIRPLGRDWLTLFGDYSLRDGQNIEEGYWGAGVEIRPVPGLHLGVKFRDVSGIDDEFRYTFNMGVTLSGLGFHAFPGYTEAGDLAKTTYLIRHHPSYRSLPVRSPLRPRSPRYVPLNLENKELTYQNYRWLDNKRVAWLDLAQHLEAIRKADEVHGVCLNLAGLSVRPSLAWELRQKLSELQQAGKEIIIHADRLSMVAYYAASVADRLTLDPQGEVVLPGLSLKRTYWKGMLEKLGIGFQEFRYFTYKSAMERFSHTDMSPADREQIGRMADVVYETVRDAVCQSRRLSGDQFDAIVDDDVLLTASMAKQRGLIDGIGRWSDLEQWLADNREGGHFWQLSPERIGRRYHEEVWGQPPKIAVVYALGECAMDTGIKGRQTSAFMRELAEDPGVAAVVMRADSPGGDPLPSDLVAEAIVQVKDAGKPVIVSQGDVAGSGGYWISMNGSRILTTPVTLTGSIGVIAGWFWDDGIGEKTGLSADGIQRGKHADLFGGVRVPIIGGTLPQRPLDTEELDMVRRLMMELYDDFVGRVGRGRQLDEGRVREIAEGRIWMGKDALALGLCDRYGSLQDAIELARQMADLEPGTEVELVEYPPRPLLEWPSLGPRPPDLLGSVAAWFGAGGSRQKATAVVDAAAELAGQPQEDYHWRYLQSLGRVAGSPVLVVPPEYLPPGWQGRP